MDMSIPKRQMRVLELNAMGIMPGDGSIKKALECVYCDGD